MSYVKTEWINDSAPDITAENLNKMEDGIYDAHQSIGVVSGVADAARSDAASAISSVNGHVASRTNPHQVTARQVGARHHKNAVQRGAVANGVADNTTLLQALLDELRDSGGGELYLPNDGGSVYRTRGLWVPSNCRIVSEGAKVAFYDGGAVRNASGDGDLISPTGFKIASQTPNRGGANIPCTGRVVIEGLVIDAAAGGYQSFTALMPADPYVLYYEANPYAGDANRKPSNVYPANSLRGLVPIEASADDIVLRDLILTGTAYDGIQITGNRVSVERVQVTGARRNNITVFAGSDIEFYRVVSNGCVAIIPLARTVNSSWTFQEYAPGCGVEVEPYVVTAMQGIRFRDCTMNDNGGAGIGVILNEGGGSTLNGCVIDGCYLSGNGGPSRNGFTILQGAVEVRGGSDAHALFITNSSLISSRTGHALELSSRGVQVVVSACDTRWNAAGVNAGTFSDGGGIW